MKGLEHKADQYSPGLETLGQKEQLNQTTSTNTREPIAVQSRDDKRRKYGNPTFIRQLEYSPQELLERTAPQTLDKNQNPSILVISPDLNEREQLEEELKLSEKSYRMIVEDQTDFICRCDLDTTISFVNQAFCRAYGRKPAELIGMSLLSFFAPEEQRSWREDLSSFAWEHPFRVYISSYINPEGESRWVEWTARAIFNEQGLIVAYQAVGRDINAHKEMEATLQKAHDELEFGVMERSVQLEQLNQQLQAKIIEQSRTEQALRESENYYRTIFENTGTAIIIIDKDLKISAANPRMAQLVGYSQDELIGTNPFEKHIAPEYLHIVQENYRLRRLDSAQAPQEYEIEAIDKQGNRKKAVLNVALIPDSQNLAVSIRDVTEQRLTELQLKASEERFRALFENAPLGIAIHRNGRNLFVNQAYANMHGYDSGRELTGNLISNRLAPECRRAIGQRIKNREKGKAEPSAYETAGLRKDGSTFPLFVQANNIMLADGPANVAFLTDITARKQSEVALERHLEAQTLLLEISKKFSNIAVDEIDAAINCTLALVGKFDSDERCHLFMVSNDRSTMSCTHEWCAPGIEAEIIHLQNLPVAKFSCWLDQMRRLECINVPSVADLPPEAQGVREFFQARSVQSVLIVPIVNEDKVIGFWGFDAVKQGKIWREENVNILDIVAQIFAKALRRRNSAWALEQSENYYRTIFENTGAATMIVEADMTISRVNQESERTFGYKKEEMEGSQWSVFFNNDEVLDSMTEYHHLRRLDPTAAPTLYLSHLKTSAGHIRQGLSYVAMIPGTAKSVATFIDLTDYKRIDRAFKAINDVNNTMIHAENEQDLLNDICQRILTAGGYSLAWVGCVHPDQPYKVQPVAYAGKNNGYLAKLNINLQDPKRGQGPTGTAIRTGLPVVSRDLKKDEKFKPWIKEALRRGFKSCMTIPLMVDDMALGALTIYSNQTDAFDVHEQELLIKMVNNLAYAIMFLRNRTDKYQTAQELKMSLEKMKRILMQAVTSLGTTLDIRDPYTAGHQRKVARLATAIAQEMGFEKDKIEGISVAGNLHDVGKINVPAEILSKPGNLSDLEFAHIKTHSQAGYEIVKDIEFPWPVAEIILQHHERMDGSGYPRGLTGEEILVEARIMAVADMVEAMASHRPYRPAVGIDLALEEIVHNSGILYDPDAVEACARLFREKGFKLE